MTHKVFTADIKIEHSKDFVSIVFGENNEIVVTMTKEQFAGILFGDKTERIGVMIEEKFLTKGN